jgi:hypothetical protein
MNEGSKDVGAGERVLGWKGRDGDRCCRPGRGAAPTGAGLKRRSALQGKLASGVDMFVATLFEAAGYALEAVHGLFGEPFQDAQHAVAVGYVVAWR